MRTEALREKFVGKTVRLKSGGPLMTVETVTETEAGPMLDCCWFDGTGANKLERALLLPSSIEPVSVPRGSVEFF
ncbi:MULTISPECIES: DUF2158 domain-containing protein [unclassified Paraburkholderia]|uniref:DUF2158 domain-containing protein n=1 Tax=unclassified Paraburkholderia TaxID=2615204 RepID=UPI0016133CCF|nr:MULTISPECIES: DUF2158 domain-containing protein [unclassified Paraburkholderia]MBB5448422.1 uncharacterized protein YodC (DUF2158 family) [Paraburkholderia sp. WSM4177]MBB5488803.1 uncharacterized protein YodC (DUF2158 family) [Paraburkholderia sp. WSM4180]